MKLGRMGLWMLPNQNNNDSQVHDGDNKSDSLSRMMNRTWHDDQCDQVQAVY